MKLKISYKRSIFRIFKNVNVMENNPTLLSFLFMCFLSSCQWNHRSNTEKEGYLIKGTGFSLPTEVVYLTTTETHALIIDSAQVSDGKFSFNIDNVKEPFKACIAYKDATGNTSVIRFKIPRQEYFEPGSISNFFVIERNDVTLRREILDEYATIEGGVENTIIFDEDYRDLTATDHSNIIDGNTKKLITGLIKRHPDSYLLINWLFANRWKFTKRDIQELHQGMAPALRDSSANGYNLKIYIAQCPEHYDPSESIPLHTVAGRQVGNYDRMKKLNMLMFTTAYIHPAQLLLHYLPNHLNMLNSPNLHIVDVGIDELEEMWRPRAEKQTYWESLHVSKEWRSMIIHRFDLWDFSNLPIVVFTDSTGNEVKRFENFDKEKSIQKYHQFVTNYLKKR